MGATQEVKEHQSPPRSVVVEYEDGTKKAYDCLSSTVFVFMSMEEAIVNGYLPDCIRVLQAGMNLVVSQLPFSEKEVNH